MFMPFCMPSIWNSGATARTTVVAMSARASRPRRVARRSPSRACACSPWGGRWCPRCRAARRGRRASARCVAAQPLSQPAASADRPAARSAHRSGRTAPSPISHARRVDDESVRAGAVCELRQQLLRHEGDARAAVLGVVAHLLGLAHRVDRHHDARPRAGWRSRRHELRAVLARQQHAVAAHDAGAALQPAGQRLGPARELGIRQLVARRARSRPCAGAPRPTPSAHCHRLPFGFGTDGAHARAAECVFMCRLHGACDEFLHHLVGAAVDAPTRTSAYMRAIGYSFM